MKYRPAGPLSTLREASRTTRTLTAESVADGSEGDGRASYSLHAVILSGACLLGAVRTTIARRTRREVGAGTGIAFRPRTGT